MYTSKVKNLWRMASRGVGLGWGLVALSGGGVALVRRNVIAHVIPRVQPLQSVAVHLG